MTNNFNITLMKIVGITLIITLAFQLKIISLKNKKQLEIEKKAKVINEEKKVKDKSNIEDILILDDYFNISKIENYKINHCIAYINFRDTLEIGTRKVEDLIKKGFTIQNYNVEYKDGYGNFNLKIKAGD